MVQARRRHRGPNKPKVIAGPDGEMIPAPVLAVEETGRPDIPQERDNVLDEPTQPARRRKRADIGGQHLKLNSPTRPGYQRRWFNDTPGRLAYAEQLAYEHVSESGIQSDSPDSRVRRLVGTTAGGAPIHAYLMETPLEEYQAGIDEKEEARKPFEEAIRRGEDTLGQPITSKAQTSQSSIR